MGKSDWLFCELKWFAVDQNQRVGMAKEIAEFNGDRLLNTSVDDLSKYFYEKFKIDPPELDLDNLTVDQREAKVDVRHDPMRFSYDYDGPHLITGSQIEVEIPFTGEAEAFKIQPTTYNTNPPLASIERSKIIFRITGLELQPEAVKGRIDSTISSIQTYLSWLRNDVNGLNNQLREEAHRIIENRRAKLLADRNLVASLGFKMKEREGAAKTFLAPEVRRKITPVMPQASSAPYKPEPALSSSDYDHILGVIEDMAQVMELSPSAFHTLDEEALRTLFLVSLNGHYQGQATGETFNYEGKTDILIRSAGKNIFIAECKFWSGAKKLTETIDQLLGYSSWRDTKTAIIVFNRNRYFSKVLSTIPEVVRTHPNYKKDALGSSETSFRYVFANRDDRNREMLLTVLAFDIPTSR